MLLDIQTQSIALISNKLPEQNSRCFQLSSNVDTTLFLCYNVKLVLQEVGWEAMDRIDLAQDRELVNSVISLRFP
jgi:hypothetical protein